MKVFLTLVGLAFVLGSPAVAVAAPQAPSATPNKEPEWKVNQRRQKLFDEGQKLVDQEKWSEALDKFREVEQLRSHPRVLVWEAFCEEHLGHVLTAQALYKQADEQAREAELPDVEQDAERMAGELAPKIPHLLLHIAPALGTEVQIDSQKVTPREGRVDVDPGKHVVVVSALGRRNYRAEVTLEPGEEKTLDVPLPEDPPPVVQPPRIPPPPVPGPAGGSLALIFVGSGFMVSGAVTTGIGFSGRSTDLRAPGVGLLVGGGLGLLAGIPWAVISSRPTPNVQRRSVSVSAAPLPGGGAFVGGHAEF